LGGNFSDPEIAHARKLLDLKSASTCSVRAVGEESRGRDMQGRSRIVAGAAIAAACFVGGRLTPVDVVSRAGAQHAPPGPAQMQPELDSDSLLVLRIRMGPHEKTGMHDVSSRLVIWLTDAHLRDTKPDGRTTEYRRMAGTTEWVPAQRHAGEN